MDNVWNLLSSYHLLSLLTPCAPTLVGYLLVMTGGERRGERSLYVGRGQRLGRGFYWAGSAILASDFLLSEFDACISPCSECTVSIYRGLELWVFYGLLPYSATASAIPLRPPL
jgi:hypothetical protein